MRGILLGSVLGALMWAAMAVTCYGLLVPDRALQTAHAACERGEATNGCDVEMVMR